ncbi:MAG TPA: imidazolonepropionase [Rhizomicrobium sp.]|jgi:imidazolonepropionase|nr:imidazolonepropionase [Rhizomicrobium sp.]
MTMVPPGLGLVEDGIVACAAGKIVYAGPRRDAPQFDGETIDCEERWLTPGLIDCHTHLVYGGDRVGEFEQRLSGESYSRLARKGGGIRVTMEATREASLDALVTAALGRLDVMIAHGVTTVEVKSGYGQSLDSELKQLRAARRLEELRKVSISPTFLAAHAVPPEFEGKPDAFVAEICETMLPKVAADSLADAVDAFCEGVGFSSAQIRALFRAAKAHGLPVKLHAEQLSNLHGARLAAEFGALSADHLEYLDWEGAEAMARAGTVAVLLPGAYYFTRETQKPPVELLRKARVPMAVATDCNPGTSPLTLPLLTMNMAATLFGLNVTECLAGMTREAARALGRLGRIGTLEARKDCDLAIWDIDQPAELVYHMGLNPLHSRVWQGQCA